MPEPLIYGPDGQPLRAIDQTVTYAHDGESYRANPIDVLVRAARMQRDGASLAAIRTELDLHPSVPNVALERALKIGHQLLNQRIIEGREAAETVVLVPVEIDEQTPLTEDLDAATE